MARKPLKLVNVTQWVKGVTASVAPAHPPAPSSLWLRGSVLEFLSESRAHGREPTYPTSSSSNGGGRSRLLNRTSNTSRPAAHGKP